MKKFSAILLSLTMILCFLPVTSQDAFADEENLIVGVENILNGLSGNGQIVVGRDVTFEYGRLMNLNPELRELLTNGEETVVGIRKSTGEDYPLTPDKEGVYSFSAPEDERLLSIWYKVTVTVPATGKVYVANMPVYVSSTEIYSLTIQVEGQGTAEAGKYEFVGDEKGTLTITPQEGWYLDRIEEVSGSFWGSAAQFTIYGNTVIKVIFKEIVTSGSCGDNAAYSFDTGTGVLTVSVTGTISEGAFNNARKKRLG